MQVKKLKISTDNNKIFEFDTAIVSFSEDGLWLCVLIGSGDAGRSYVYSIAHVVNFSFEGISDLENML